MVFRQSTSRRCALAGLASVLGAAAFVGPVLAGGGGGGSLPVPADPEALFMRGTQPLSGGLNGGNNVDLDPILPSNICANCHADYGPDDAFLVAEPFEPWAASMMGQSARDPLLHACMAIASQDVQGSEQFCIRCHVPNAFLDGRTPVHPSEFTALDNEGINCNFCHRLVDPVYDPGVDPDEDAQIIADLDEAGWIPSDSSNSRYVISPPESRRGPFPLCEDFPNCGPDDVPQNVHGVPTFGSDFHTRAELCWNCHDVSNPLMVAQGDGTYQMNGTAGMPIDTPHPTGEQVDMFPLHRTYSEWENSYYSSVGVSHVGRFGGTKTEPLTVCQDCHMPDTQGYGCNFEFLPFFERTNMPQHSFIGSNTWVMEAIRDLYPDAETGLTEQSVADHRARNLDLMQNASDLFLSQEGDQVKARIVNFSGHKLPSGYPDGRRMWINVKFFDCVDNLILEHGAYDFVTADLTQDTKVYEMLLGIDATQSARTGLPVGDTHHFMLANVVTKDNRIPPAGWFLSNAIANQTEPVGATYTSGQHWDDTFYDIPTGTARTVVTVYYQTTSKEYIEFLRDTNLDQSPTSLGMIAYDQWELQGKSAPIVMDMVEIMVDAYHPADINQDGNINVVDLLAMLAAWGVCDPLPPGCDGDINNDGFINVVDLLQLLALWNSPCP